MAVLSAAALVVQNVEDNGALLTALAGVLDDLGWTSERPDDVDDWMSLSLSADDSGKCWLWLGSLYGVGHHGLMAKELSRQGFACRAFIAQLDEDKLRRGDDDELGWDVDLDVFDVEAGVARRLTAYTLPDDELLVNHGDAYETLEWFLRMQTDGEDSTLVVHAHRQMFYRKPTDLSPRLQSLVADVQRARGYSVVDMAGQQMVRLKFEDGSTRMSAVSDSELAELEKLPL